MAWELLEEEQQSPSFASEALRHTARTGSNIVTSAAGLPGDILSLANEFIANPIVEAFGGKASPYEGTYLGRTLPTGSTLRQESEEQFGGYLKPRNEIEKFVSDVAEDAALLFSPGKIAKGAKIGRSVLGALGKSIGANIAGEVVQQTTGSMEGAAATKAGTLMVLSLIDPRMASREVSKLYGEARAALPETARTSATSLEKNLSKLEHQITKGRPKSSLSAAEKFVLDKADGVKSLIEDGKINIEQAWAQKRSLNEDLTNLYKDFDKGSAKGIRNNAKQVTGALNQTLSEYGKDNRAFYKPFKAADEAYGALAQSQRIGNWVTRNLKTLGSVVGLGSLFDPTVIAGAAGVVAIHESAKLMYKIGKSPTLRKLYGNAIQAAAKENAPLFNRYYQELDKGLAKELDQEKWEFID